MTPFHATPSGPLVCPGDRGTSAWDYEQLTPTTWLWTSPHDIRYLVHPDGTTTL